MSQEVAAESTTAAQAAVLYNEEYRPWWVGMLVLVPFLLPAFWTYHVCITEETLSFGYSSNLTQVYIEDRMSVVQKVEAVEHINGLMDWGGWGIRKRLFTSETGYIAKNGPGVHITMTTQNGNKELSYVFSCDDPATVTRILSGIST